jgi:hypothetical protein
MILLDISPYNAKFVEKIFTSFSFTIFFTLKYGSPIFIPKIFASVDREITHPSLLDNTMTGFLIIEGLNNLSQET